MNKRMSPAPPAAAPPDLFDVRPLECEERPPPDVPISLLWARLTVVYLAAFGATLLFRFPGWAMLALPLAALATQAVRRLRWPYRVASATVFAVYAAQVSSIVNSPAGWVFRFASAFVLLLAAAICWGLRMDEL